MDLEVTERRLWEGCWAGLAERTAVVEIAVSGDPGDPRAAARRFTTAAELLCPDEPLVGVDPRDWPSALLLESPGCGPQEWLGRWIIGLTVAIQRWGHDPVWRGRVLHAEADRLRLAIPWRRQAAFNDALELAVRLIGQWSAADEPPTAPRNPLGHAPTAAGSTVAHHLGERWAMTRSNGLSLYTLRLVQAGVVRGMPFDVLPNCVQLGWGEGAERFDMTFTGRTGWIAATMAKNKAKTSLTLAEEALPVPPFALVRTVDDAERAAGQLGYPVVVKPPNLDMGLGVVPDIGDPDALGRAFDDAVRRTTAGVIVEKHVPGECYRLLVVHGRVLSALLRYPARVIGDGVHTVEQLVGIVNSDPRRGRDLVPITINDVAVQVMAEQGLDQTAVPEAGRIVVLRRTPYVYTGGTTADVTAAVHPDNRALAQRAVRIAGLDIAGVDFLCPDISRSWREVGGAINEINSQPALSLHWAADPGRDFEGEIVESVFDGRPARIPTAVFTGGSDADAGTDLVHEVWTAAGRRAGSCTSRGLRVGQHRVSAADLSGLRGVRALLIDPAVQVAVFVLRPEVVVAQGHYCDRYDVVAVLDPPGVAGSELVERARSWLVLAGDDADSVALRSRNLTARAVFVNPGRQADGHRRPGDAAVVVDADGRVTVDGDGEVTVLLPWSGQRAQLFAAAVAWAQRIPVDRNRAGLGG